MPEKCAENCPFEPRIKSLEEENKRSADRREKIYERLEKVERDNAVQGEQYKTILDKLETLTAKAEALEAKPGKRWESIVDKAVWAVCAAVIAFLLGRVGF